MPTTISRITRRSHPDGIEACIRDTNINVWSLVLRRQLGWSDERILKSVQGLTQDDLDAAWEYAARHPAEIEAFIRRNEEA
jgi:uncharacterized protein (DUF433 family)